MCSQYVSLAHFLSQKQHIEPFADDKEHPNLVVEQQWSDWKEYWEAAGAALTCAANAEAEESCACQ